MDAPPTPPTSPPAWEAPTAAPSMPVQRPGTVTAAAIIMIVLGALSALFALLFALGGALLGGAISTGAGELTPEESAMVGALGGAFAGAIIFIGVILLGVGILNVVAGAKVLSGRGWARITGIVLAVILGLLSLLGMTGGGDQGAGIIVNVIFLLANAFIVYALWTGGPWFRARTAASTSTG